MSDAESRRAIEQALQAFAAQPLKVAATGLFNALGYASKKTLDLKPNGIHRTAGEGLRSCYDADQTLCNHTVMVCLPWHALDAVRNNSRTTSRNS